MFSEWSMRYSAYLGTQPSRYLFGRATVGSAERWGIFPPRTTWFPVCVAFAFASVIFSFQVELFSTFASPADGCVIAYGGEESAGQGTGIRASRCQNLFLKIFLIASKTA
jgi:hypothetical protein